MIMLKPSSSSSSIILPNNVLLLHSISTRNFSISADRIRYRTIIPSSNYSLHTTRRQLLAKSTRYSMSHTEFQLARQPFNSPVHTKLPFQYRKFSPNYLMAVLQREEQSRILTEFPRHVDKFVTGDRVCITKLISLIDRSKIERIYGTVIATSRMNHVDAMFVIRNIKLGEAFELNIPLYSPFIVRIDVLQRAKSKYTRKKQYEIRDMDTSAYETVLEENLPKTAEGIRIIAKDNKLIQQQAVAEGKLSSMKKKERTNVDEIIKQKEAAAATEKASAKQQENKSSSEGNNNNNNNNINSIENKI